jgi:phage baseplate assembly protein W
MLQEIKGLNFPLRFTGAGNFGLASKGDKLIANLKMIVTTSINQRVMRPNFGVPSEDLLFTKLESVSTIEIEADIKEAITIYEPRVKLIAVSVVRNDLESKFEIEIQFKQKSLGYQSVQTTRISV